MLSMKAVLRVAAFGSAVQALAFGGPQPTDALIPSPALQLPEITVPPSVHELMKRQSDVETVLVGPDNTCGFVSGRIGAAYSCVASTATCVFITTALVGAVGCCDSTECGIRVACLDMEQVSSSSLCDSGCLHDTLTVKCTQSTAPYCGTVSFFDGIQDYYCDYLSISTAQQAYTTYAGETDGRTFSAVALTLDASSSLQLTSARNSGSNTGSGVSTGSSSASGSTVTSGSSGSNGGSGGGSSTHVGAIVGGVVGGAAVIALIIGLGIWFLVRHNKKKKAAATPPANPPMQQQPPYNGPPPAGGIGSPGHQSVYDPNYAQQTGAQQPYYPPQGYPSPPQHYQQGYFPQGGDKPSGMVAMNTNQTPDRNDSTSPVSQMTSQNRLSQQPSSPNTPSSFQPAQQNQYNQQHVQPPATVYEAGSNTVGSNEYNQNHRGEIHELH